MGSASIRRPAVAGAWYPASPAVLADAVDGYLADAAAPLPGQVLALAGPHAGLIYSGPVAAYAYRAVQSRPYEVVVLVGPSHRVAFEGVASYGAGAFDTPLGPIPIDEETSAAIRAASSVVRDSPGAHAREHSLEMHLPFLARVQPGVPIVPLLMGLQHPGTIDDLAGALAAALRGRRALLVASTDLSHYHDAVTAARLDARVIDAVARLDPDALAAVLQEYPDHACGGGPLVAVMKAAQALGARHGRVLRYADSGDVSGDKDAVVGYMAAVMGVFDDEPPAGGAA